MYGAVYTDKTTGYPALAARAGAVVVGTVDAIVQSGIGFPILLPDSLGPFVLAEDLTEQHPK